MHKQILYNIKVQQDNHMNHKHTASIIADTNNPTKTTTLFRTTLAKLNIIN
jgi:hypothetical protein